MSRGVPLGALNGMFCPRFSLGVVRFSELTAPEVRQMLTPFCKCPNPLICCQSTPPDECLVPARTAARVVGDEFAINGTHLLSDIRRGRHPSSRFPYQRIENRVFYLRSDMSEFLKTESKLRI